MCGIVGYVGRKEATPILVEGLRKLEYRGYDSAGVAVLEEDTIQIVKAVGKLSFLENKLQKEKPTGNIGIGHTRWATHGKPSAENSHPHADCSGDFAVVHNGIIENYLELKEWLMEQGHVFSSETDTEVVAHLIEHYYEGDLEEAVRKTLQRIEGSYALGILCKKEPGKLIGVRKDSPLVVGIGEGENFIASDIPAILSHTRKCYLIDDGEICILTPDTIKITTISGEIVNKEIFNVSWDAEAAEKGGFEHFMLKEIYEQPAAFRKTLSGRTAGNKVQFPDFHLPMETVSQWKKIYIVGCGTAYHAGLVGKTVFEQLLRIPVEVDIASEFRYREPLVDEETLVIVISQSGETADTLAALREAKHKGAAVLAITNVVGSSISREADFVVYIWAGPEIAVASTKAYTTMLVAEYLLALYLGQLKGLVSDTLAGEIINALHSLPEATDRILKETAKYKEVAEYFKDKHDVFFIGRGFDWAVALEGSLKLKEISYIHAEAYAAGELKHGTLALITQETPVIALCVQQKTYDKTLSNIKEVKARDAQVLAIAVEGDTEVGKYVDDVITIPEINNFVAPVLTVIPLQLIAYYAAVARGCNVDQPRNLAKSVTVE
ncbi:MAG: glutamine--fructose-6-phosphate transaminase (isomerizing) [Clostridia bacterium]|nr:glutamine--fructose-6-phosphate transaminase (isomerizing) [Clostridia bacterium]